MQMYSPQPLKGEVHQTGVNTLSRAEPAWTSRGLPNDQCHHKEKEKFPLCAAMSSLKAGTEVWGCDRAFLHSSLPYSC